MGMIYKRGRVWYLDLRVNGRRVRKRVGSSKDVAQLALKDAEIQAARNEFGFIKKEMPLQRFLAEFDDFSRANHRVSTQTRYRAVIDHFKRFLREHPNVVLLSQINASVVDKYKVYRRDSWVNPNGQPVNGDDDITQYTRKGAKAHTINFEIGALKTILNQAIKWGYLKENPTKGITKLKVEDSKQPRFLTKEECQRFLEACSPDLYAVFFTFLNTGMRKAELENLEWADINLGQRKINIRAKKHWQPKTGERVIPMNDAVHDLLKKLKGRNDRDLKSKYVFPHDDGGKIRSKLREQLIRIAKNAGIADLTKVHTLRHTFASHLVMSGVDLPTVKRLMGHSDIDTTMIYAHLAPDHLADAVNKLQASLALPPKN